MTTLLIATTNPHKVAEIRAILGSEFECLTLNDYSGTPQVVEDADTFAGNAAKKSCELAHWLLSSDAQLPEFVLADDSGLEVDALNGAPGVHSARFAALDSGASRNSSSAENNAKLLLLLTNIPLAQRAARFRCVLALTSIPDLKTETFDGTCEGRLGFDPRGRGGFGYDPLFTPEGYSLTFGELGEEVKNLLSHRAKALQKLKRHLTKRTK